MPRGRNDYETAQIQGRLWTPEVLRPAAWFDAADLSTISVSTGVSEWRDKSGNARNATQSTAANQPALMLNEQNGLSAIDFDGSNDALLINSSLSTALSGDNTYSIAMALKPDVTSNQPALMHENSGTGLNWFTQIRLGGGLYWGDTSANYREYSNSIFSVGSASIVSVIKTGNGTGDAFAAGAAISPISGTLASTPTLSNSIRIGDYSNPSFNYNGKFLEILIATDNWPLPSRSAVEGYLAWKWGIPLAADHPFANRPPLIGD